MSAELIRYVGLGITMLIVNFMIERLHRQGNVGEGTDTRYVVEAPGLLKSVYMTMFLVGLFLYFFFLFHIFLIKRAIHKFWLKHHITKQINIFIQ